jgi:hypothetical protein
MLSIRSLALLLYQKGCRFRARLCRRLKNALDQLQKKDG